MRGVAALLVAFYHLRYSPATGAAWYWIFRLPFGGRGYLWVDFFFLLSGFILALRYGEECRVLNLRVYGTFLWHRIARIWPVHLVTLAAGCAWVLWNAPGNRLPWQTVAANAALVHSWGHHFLPDLNFPSWSLSAEWGVYLVLPFYLLVAVGIRSVLAHGAICGGLLLLLAWYAGTGSLDRLHEQGGLGRCALEAAIGVSLWQIYRRLPRNPASARAFDAAAFAIAISVVVVLVWTTNDLYFVPLAAGLILCLSAAQGRFTRLLCSRPLVRLGEISFSIYMVHAFVFNALYLVPKSFVSQVGITRGVGILILAHAVVIALAWMLYEWIERPAYRKLTSRGRFAKRSGDAPKRCAELKLRRPGDVTVSTRSAIP